MGRRTIQVKQQEHWIFNRVAAAYRSRPGYPDDLVELLCELAHRTGGRVLDLGAGTGHLALPLARGGHRVTAVEPARAMLAELTSSADRQGLRVAAVNASAERTGLPSASFDLVVVADALHWMDPELAGQEVARLLAPGGALAVIEARLADTPFMRDLGELLASRNPRAKAGPSTLAQFLSPTAPGQAPRVARFEDEAPLDGEALAQLIQSLTYVGPALGEAKLREIVAAAGQLLLRHPGASWRRVLTMSWVERASRIG